MTYGPENDPCFLWCIHTMAEKQNNINRRVNDDVDKAAMDLCLAHHHQNQEIRPLNISYDISRFLNNC